MSSTAGPARIILPIEIELDKATAQLQGFRRTAVDEVGAAAKVIEADLSKAEKSATTLGTSTVTAAKGMRQEMQGAGAAVGGVMQAINLVGAQAPPAIGGIARAFASLLMTGITPVGLALAGVTGLIALFSATSTESDKATKAIDKQAASLRALREEIGRVQLARRAGAAGTSVDAQSDLERIGSLGAEQERLAGQAARNDALIAGFQARLANGGRDASGRYTDAEVLRANIANAQESNAGLRKTIFDMQVEIDLLSKKFGEQTIAAAEAERRRLAEEERKRREAGTSYRLGDLSGAMAGVDTLTDAELAAGARRRAAAAGDMDPSGFIRSAHGFAGNVGRLRGGTLSAYDAQEHYLPSVVSPQRMGSPITLPSYTSGLDRQMQESTERSVTQGIADALSPDRNKGAFERFALAMADTLRTRVAQGLADALLGNGKNFGTGGMFGSLFGGGGGPPGGPGSPAPSGAEVISSGPTTYYSTPLGPGKRAMKAEDSTPIVVMVGVDEASADHIVSKASGRGARAVFVKAQGGGVGAGTIPGRRR